MTQQQFIQEIKRLSIAERIALIEAISRDLREELTSRADNVSAVPPTTEQAGPQHAEQGKASLSQRLRGIVKFDGPPPTDEELKDAYTDYLVEKYS